MFIFFLFLKIFICQQKLVFDFVRLLQVSVSSSRLNEYQCFKEEPWGLRKIECFYHDDNNWKFELFMFNFFYMKWNFHYKKWEIAKFQWLCLNFCLYRQATVFPFKIAKNVFQKSTPNRLLSRSYKPIGKYSKFMPAIISSISNGRTSYWTGR